MQSIPISVEAVDHAGPSKAMAKNSHLTPKKATKAKSVKERENLSTKGDVTSHRDCELQLTESSARKESRNDKEKKMTQKPADEDLSDPVAITSNGNATRIKAEKIKTTVPQTSKYGEVFLRTKGLFLALEDTRLLKFPAYRSVFL